MLYIPYIRYKRKKQRSEAGFKREKRGGNGLKRKEKDGNRLRRLWTGFSLVDRCLLIFFGVLLFQSVCSMFYAGDAGAEAEHIDVIVRTSLASIFGYILSANFTGAAKKRGGNGPEEDGETEKGVVSAQSADQTGESTEPEEPTARAQILTATVIGLISLAVLLIYRNLEPGGASGESGYATAASAQLRDFVSGSVGFLIGSPGEQKP